MAEKIRAGNAPAFMGDGEAEMEEGSKFAKDGPGFTQFDKKPRK